MITSILMLALLINCNIGEITSASVSATTEARNQMEISSSTTEDLGMATQVAQTSIDGTDVTLLPDNLDDNDVSFPPKPLHTSEADETGKIRILRTIYTKLVICHCIIKNRCAKTEACPNYQDEIKLKET